MLRGVWQIFTLLSLILIVFGSGWGTVTVLLGLALMTLLATFMLLRVGMVIETMESRAVKTKRTDAGFIDSYAEPNSEPDVNESEPTSYHLALGDDGELAASDTPDLGNDSTQYNRSWQLH